jgi:glycerophosphoryl diester phosphodiesterase
MTTPIPDVLFAGSGTPVPAFIAHRGASREAPENTIPAFDLAWKQGADGIEGDYRLTKDGEIVCLHDATTKRTTGRDIDVAGATLAELRQLDAGSWKGSQWKGVRIPTIDEVLATVPNGKRVFIEIKCGPEILPVLKREVAASGLQPEQVVMIGFDAEILAEAKRQLPEMKSLWLTVFGTNKYTRRVFPAASDILATLERIGADGVDCESHAVIDQQFVQALHAAHKEVHVWTVDRPDTAKRFFQLGVDSVTSNRAGWLKQQFHGKTA